MQPKITNIDDLRESFINRVDVDVKLSNGKKVTIPLCAPTAEAVQTIRESMDIEEFPESDLAELWVRACLDIEGATDDDVTRLLVNSGGIKSPLIKEAATLCGMEAIYGLLMQKLKDIEELRDVYAEEDY